MKVLAFAIGILIGCTILMMASFIYRAYWGIRLKKEIYKSRTEPLENGDMTIEEIRELYRRENEKNSL